MQKRAQTLRGKTEDSNLMGTSEGTAHGDGSWDRTLFNMERAQRADQKYSRLRRTLIRRMQVIYPDQTHIKTRRLINNSHPTKLNPFRSILRYLRNWCRTWNVQICLHALVPALIRDGWVDVPQAGFLGEPTARVMSLLIALYLPRRHGVKSVREWGLGSDCWAS